MYTAIVSISSEISSYDILLLLLLYTRDFIFIMCTVLGKHLVRDLWLGIRSFSPLFPWLQDCAIVRPDTETTATCKRFEIPTGILFIFFLTCFTVLGLAVVVLKPPSPPPEDVHTRWHPDESSRQRVQRQQCIV